MPFWGKSILFSPTSLYNFHFLGITFSFHARHPLHLHTHTHTQSFESSLNHILPVESDSSYFFLLFSMRWRGWMSVNLITVIFVLRIVCEISLLLKWGCAWSLKQDHESIAFESYIVCIKNLISYSNNFLKSKFLQNF